MRFSMGAMDGDTEAVFLRDSYRVQEENPYNDKAASETISNVEDLG